MAEEYFFNEDVTCDYCNKVLEVRDDKIWLKLLEITKNQISDENRFCSYECLMKWLSESDYSALQRIVAQHEDEKWRAQEKEMKGTQ